jgi:hypothetical protein
MLLIGALQLAALYQKTLVMQLPGFVLHKLQGSQLVQRLKLGRYFGTLI